MPPMSTPSAMAWMNEVIAAPPQPCPHGPRCARCIRSWQSLLSHALMALAALGAFGHGGRHFQLGFGLTTVCDVAASAGATTWALPDCHCASRNLPLGSP